MDLQIANNPDVPIYRRIADTVCEAIASGQIAPGAKLPAQTKLAKQLGVNALTVSRGYELLESRGIVSQKRGSGTYVQMDAQRHARQTDRRRLASLAMVVGESSLARCPRETVFIVTDIIEGMRDILGPKETHFVFAESLSRDCMDTFLNSDGVLAFASCPLDRAVVKELVDRGLPVVSLWDSSPVLTPLRVTYDREHSTALACGHLVSCGYRRIGFIGRKAYGRSPVSPKFGAFTSAMHDAGLDILARDIRDAGREPGRAYAAIHDILKSGDLPEAFFVDTDYKAMEVIGALKDAGLSVPGDVGIVSYDDVPEAATFMPPLTTVRVPRRRIGQRAAEMLLNYRPDSALPPETVLKSELVVRESCRPARVSAGELVETAG